MWQLSWLIGARAANGAARRWQRCWGRADSPTGCAPVSVAVVQEGVDALLGALAFPLSSLAQRLALRLAAWLGGWMGGSGQCVVWGQHSATGPAL